MTDEVDKVIAVIVKAGYDAATDIDNAALHPSLSLERSNALKAIANSPARSLAQALEGGNHSTARALCLLLGRYDLLEEYDRATLKARRAEREKEKSWKH